MSLAKDVEDKIKSSTKIALFGAGIVATKVYQWLNDAGYNNKVCCFIQSNKDKTSLFGYPVFSFNELSNKKDILFLICATGNFYYQIENLLKNVNEEIRYVDARSLAYESYNLSQDLIEARDNKIREYIKRQTKINNYRKRAVISHVTYCQTGNAGDTFLSYCVRQFLGYSDWNIIKVSDAVTEDVIKRINQTDGLVIGGGGLFLPDTNENDISGWQWAISDELLNKITVPIIVYGVGYNYFYGHRNSILFVDSLNALVRKASFVGLRNTGSINAVCDILDKDLQKKVFFQPCITTVFNNYNRSESEVHGDCIGVNMAFDRSDMRFSNDKEKICREVALAIKRIEILGYKICYLAHTEEDILFLKYLDEEKVNYKYVNLSMSLPEEIIDTYNRVELMIGMRGHAQMIPFGLGKKIISLGTHPKMKWFIDDICLDEAYIDLQKTNNLSEAIVSTTIKAINDAEYAKKNADIRALFYRSSISNREIIDDILGLERDE